MLLNERLRELFMAYDQGIQMIVQELLVLEQEYISVERPRIKDQVDDIITRVANREIKHLDER